jgi:alpha-glucosidase
VRALLGRAVAASSVVVLVVACGGADEPGASPRPRPPTRPSPEQGAAADRLLTGPDWYRHAVFYEVNVRSFQDSDGDGIGDLPGLVSRLDYLKDLGVDALWLMPINPSPFKDSGYDVADYGDVDKVYGGKPAFDVLVREAHARKMRVMVDLVLNHTSDQHPWFQESRKDKTNPKADYYVWSDTDGRSDVACGTYSAQFGTSAWAKDDQRGQYYYHRFYPGQPDLNYKNPAVVSAVLDAAKGWLDSGADGFRCDVIGLLVETADPEQCSMAPETQAIIRKLRALLDTYPDRAMVAEPLLGDARAYYGSGRDMFHMAFDFSYGYFWGVAFSARSRKLVDVSMAQSAAFPEGAQNALVIGSHDVQRAFTVASGHEWRQRRAAEIQLLRRGTPFVYYGEEVGLRPGAGVVVDSRDSARTPMTWARGPGHGFTKGTPWLAFGPMADETSVEAEDRDPESMLTFYRSLLAFRRGRAVWSTGAERVVGLDTGSVVAFLREDGAERYLVAVSLSEEEVDAALVERPAGVAEVVWGDGALGADGRLKLPARGSAVFRLR